MTKKRPAVIIAAVALALVVGAVALFSVFHFNPDYTLTAVIPEGVSDEQTAMITITEADYRLVLQARDAGADAETRNVLLDEYKKAQILRKGDMVFFDLLTDNRQRIIFVIWNKGKQVKKYLLEETLLLTNTMNKELQIIKDDYQKNAAAQELPLFDPFLNNPACLEVFEKRETSKRGVNVYELTELGHSADQIMHVYETQNNFQTKEIRGTIFPAGTDLAAMALLLEMSLDTLLGSVNTCDITVDGIGALTSDTLFVTFKRQTFDHERDVTITNPLPEFDGAETRIFSKSDSGIVEVSYRTPQFINTAKDIVSSNIMSKPESMEQCDEAFFNNATRQFGSKLLAGDYDFELWADVNVGGTGD